MSTLSPEDLEVEQFKLKKLIRNLQAARGAGTSVISLVIPPGGQIAQINQMLTVELGTASNIKSRVNRLSVLSAIGSVQTKLKTFNNIPPNGLALYCGEVLTSDGKTKKISVAVEPFKPINTSLYLCDNHFHVEALLTLLENDDKYGFIVIDGNGALFGTLSGSTRTVLHKFTVDLPKKHGRGGQSAQRFGRIRLEKRQNYVRKVAETATQMYITNNMPNVSGLFLCGSAEFKQQLQQSQVFDPRLSKIILGLIDVSYGGENGFNQAIEMAGESLADVKFVKEKRELARFFNDLAQDNGKYAYGITDTVNALEMGAVDQLLVWDELELVRYELRNAKGETVIKYLTPEQENDTNNFTENGANLEVVEKELFIDWISVAYKNYGSTLTFVTNKSPEGSQFVKGFGGVGAFLRYQLDMTTVEVEPVDDFGFI